MRDFLFADDCALAAHSEVDLQELADCFATAATSFGLTVSIKKTEVLRQLAPNTARPPPNITINGNALKNVDTFKYLGSCINSAANLDDEVLCRISRASQAFGHLHTRVWHERCISIKTKLSVYRAVVLPSLLYGCETWTCYRRHTKKLDQFHLRCLRKVLRVSWKEHVPNQEILRSAELTGIEAMLNQAQLRWSGHVTRIDDSRPPKQLFHAELSTGKRHKGGQRKRYKDVLKSTLKACNIPVDEWQALAQDRPAWREEREADYRAWMIRDRQGRTECQTLALLYLVSSATRSALLLSGSKLICANTSTDTSSSYLKDYYYYYHCSPHIINLNVMHFNYICMIK